MRLLNSFVISMLVTVSLAGCGGSSGDTSSAAAEQTGQVTVLVGDHRAIGWDHVWITFSEVRFIGGAGQSVFVMDEAKELDLLALENYTERLVPTRDVLAGPIRKIRFVLDDVLLQRTDSDGSLVSFNPPLPPGFKVDLLLNNAQVRAGEKLVLEVDVDLRRSLHRDRQTGDVAFRPVFRAESSTEAFEPRLMRLEGDVDGLVDGVIRVCDITSVADRERTRNVCMLLETHAETEFYKAEDDSADVMVQSGDHIVAYGLIDMDAAEDTLVANVVAVGGEFARLKGEALTMVEADVFQVDVASEGEPIAKSVGLKAGARVFDSVPKEVNAGAIAVGNYLEAEGFAPMLEGDVDVDAFIVLLNHDVIVVDDEPTPTTTIPPEQRAGVIMAYALPKVFLEPDFACIEVTPSTVLTQLSSDGTSTTVTDIPAVPTDVDQFIDAEGVVDAATNCLIAETAVLEII